MKDQQEKIRRFSKAVHIMLSITLTAAIIIVAGEALVLFSASLSQPYLLNVGQLRIPAPAWMTDSAVWGFSAAAAPALIADAAQAITSLIVLALTKNVFRLLRDNGTPFRTDVVKAFKNLAIALIFLGAASGLAGLIAAAVVGTLCMIFNYGRALQDESDRTL